MKSCASFLIGLLLAIYSHPTFGQISGRYAFGYSQLPPVTDRNGQALPFAWQGGLNSPQFSASDINNDGLKDLVVFDRYGVKPYIYLAQRTGNQISYVYNRHYAEFFPLTREWVLMRDIDCDGRDELFTYSLTNIYVRVFKNISLSSQPNFVLLDSMIRTTTFSGRTVPLSITSGDIPYIGDVDGDGDLDIVNQEFAGTGFEWHVNRAADSGRGTPCRWTSFRKQTNCFGGIASPQVCGNYIPLNCREGEFDQPPANGRPMHLGATVNLWDVTGDGRKDLLAGDVSCPQIFVLANNSASGYSFSSTPLANFPNAQNFFNLRNFPASYVIDIDQDGDQDLIIAPNILDPEGGLNPFRDCVHWYRNDGSDARPSYVLADRAFLQSSSLDFGYDAKVAIGDIDGDGLEDILVGTAGRRIGPRPVGQLWWLRNTGTRTAPSFAIADTNYLNLLSRGWGNINPSFGDINQDGREDLLIGIDSTNGNRGAFWLAAQANGPRFNLSTPLPLPGVDWNPADAPAFFDGDNDGLLDLLIGRFNGSVLYYRNIGTAASPNYSLISSSVAGLVSGRGMFSLNLAVGDADGDGLPDLVTTDQTGTLRFYPNIRQGILDVINPVVNFQREYPAAIPTAQTVGAFSKPALKDLNGDGRPEVVVGLGTGGLTYFWNTLGNTPTQSEGRAGLTTLSLYPNPGSSHWNLTLPEPGTLTISDAQGQILWQQTHTEGLQKIPCVSWSHGLYFFHFKGSSLQLAAKAVKQ